jgi:phosphoglycolate phosphatase
MKGQTLIFDYDGTIHDTLKIYEPAFREVYERLAGSGVIVREEITSARIAGWIGMNVKEMWDDFQPGLPAECKERAGAVIGELMMRRVRERRAVWYPGAQQVLEILGKKYDMVVLSNCDAAYRLANWCSFGMERWFDAFYDCGTYGFAPKAEIIQNIMRTYPGGYTVIGDRAGDMACARAAGCRFIGCLYGFGVPGELTGNGMTAENIAAAEGDVLINDIRELPDIL